MFLDFHIFLTAPSTLLLYPPPFFVVSFLTQTRSEFHITKNMLTCIARPKKLEEDSESNNNAKSVKSLTCQIKDMALKASGVYKSCNPCTPATRLRNGGSESEVSDSEKFRRTRTWGKEMEARLKGISSGEGTPSSSSSSFGGGSGRRVVVLEEEEGKEWVAQVEPGVLITFVSLPRGGNDLKRIRFSRDIFNKWQAQRWWAENYDKVMELYNVQRLNRQAFPLPTPARSEDESSKRESIADSPVTPPLTKEQLSRNLYRPTGMGMGYSSSDSFDQHSLQSKHYQYDLSGMNSTPKVSTISAAKTDISSVAASIRSSSSREADRSGDLSMSNASDPDSEWVEEDEPGVYITIRSMPGGKREIRRVRFSREKFGEMHARLWWEENRARVHAQYL